MSAGACDPALKSWVGSANVAGCDFPLQNLPFGVTSEGRVAVAIGDRVLDVHGVADDGLLEGIAHATAEACRGESLNALMGLGRGAARELRERLSLLLRDDASEEIREAVGKRMSALSDAAMRLPAAIGDYTDFYASMEHATRVGEMFRPERPLLPNYRYLPIGYHGRASSVVVSGTSVRRPRGQRLNGERPVFGPTQMLDYEVELGCFVGGGNALGEPVPLCEAEDHIFGCCLLNDWSARDVQSWEYQPLGPFLGKSFATSVSPWVVTMDALEPFRVPARIRGQDDPALPAYLRDTDDERTGGIDVRLEVRLRTARMRERGLAAFVLSASSTAYLYWTLAQMLTHHTSNGCNLRPGDLLGSGTVSGAENGARGCLLELTRRGAEPVLLPSGEQRGFLEDGDEVVVYGYCERDGATRIGFGECRGIISTALGNR